MNRSSQAETLATPGIEKAPTGIAGLDTITEGGLPRGRTTLVTGSAGCGKTLLAMEFLVRGATEFDEPGLFVAFEETAEELTDNVRSLGFDLDELVEQGKLDIDHVRIERSEIEETGEYDLEALFIRLGFAIDTIGAKRVVLDTMEVLFGGLQDEAVLRSELRRLFRWLKDKGVTAIVTGERREESLTRHGLEEFVSDCVILLDHRVHEQLTTRRLRIVKYRGTTHGTNEYPFLIESEGISVVPITALRLEHDASSERISTGVEGVDAMLGGKGVFRASSVLISGTAGTGKTSLAAHFAAAACQRGERCLYLSHEESPEQLVRNMRSIGLDLAPWRERGLLNLAAHRTSMFSLEKHLTTIYRQVIDFEPHMVVLDPLTNFLRAGSDMEVNAMLVRLIDFLKSRGITAVFTSLTRAGGELEDSGVEITSLVDTWVLLRDIELGADRSRGIYVLKSRGMAHSHKISEFKLSDRGFILNEMAVGPSGMLSGRMSRLHEEQRDAVIHARRRELERRRRFHEARMELQIAEIESELQNLERAADGGSAHGPSEDRLDHESTRHGG